MPLINNNLSPLAFYDSLDQQNHLKDYAFGQAWPIVVDRNKLIPFQVILTTAYSSITGVRLYNFNTGEYLDVTNTMLTMGLRLVSYSGQSYRLLMFPGRFPLDLGLNEEGRYYLRIAFNGSRYIYSDVFSCVGDTSKYLEIEYWNDYPFTINGGLVDFGGDYNFKFKLWLDTQIGKPEYVFEEEATERMGYSFIETQVSKKRYNFTFVAPEYICDAMRIIRMCNNVQITSKGLTYKSIKFEMEVDWEEQGDLASVVCTFDTDTVIANPGGYRPVECGGGDFSNGDYNSDYDNDECTSGGGNNGRPELSVQDIYFGVEGGTAELIILVKNQTTNWHITANN